jgi:hypothetical protein
VCNKSAEKKMKKSLLLTILVVVLAFFAVSCGDDKKTVDENDDDTAEVNDEETDEVVDEVIDETETDDVADESEVQDEDAVDPCADKECPENSTCVVEGEEAVCECDEGYHPTNGECISDTEMTEIGDFTVAFKGPINATNNPSAITPGTGDAQFTYFEEELTYTVLHVDNGSIKIDFPFASVADGGMIAATWIDEISFTPKFFAINVPDDLEVGTDIDFVENQVYTLYGDLTYDGSNVAIKCIRAVSGEAKLEIKELTATDIEVSASGKLIDPVYASELGYNLPEVCED